MFPEKRAVTSGGIAGRVTLSEVDPVTESSTNFEISNLASFPRDKMHQQLDGLVPVTSRRSGS